MEIDLNSNTANQKSNEEFAPIQIPQDEPKKNFSYLKELFKIQNELNKTQKLEEIELQTVNLAKYNKIVIQEEDLTKKFRIETDCFEFKTEGAFNPVRLILENSKLTLYSSLSIKKERVIFSVDFNQLTANAILNKNNKNQFKLKILGSPINFIFRTKNREVIDRFLICLNYHLGISRGGRENLLGVSLRRDFYKCSFISEKEYINISKSGDLLIFRGYDCPANCQRCLTGAEYDHVALLVKKDGRLHVYESTSKDGCKLRDWNDFVRYSWHVLYEKMVYRKLIFKVDDSKKSDFKKSFQKNLNDFLDTTKGKPYRLTCNKLFCGKARDYELENNWERCKGFYCSQLVSAGLMKLKIIEVQKGAGQYLPGAFAEEGNLDTDITEFYEYGPEIIIDFSL